MQNILFKVGDTVRVYFQASGGAKTKPTPFEGIIIATRGTNGNKTFTVRKVTKSKIAIERIFPANSPFIEKITVLKSDRVRRAKLYYLRRK